LLYERIEKANPCRQLTAEETKHFRKLDTIANKLKRGENVLIFHSDLQYKPFNFVNNNLNKIKHNDYTISFIIAFRKNREFIGEILSKLLRLVSRMILGLKPMDYNAQPKIFFNNIDLKIFDRIDGFSADLAICQHLNNLKFYSIDISENRHQNAVSSWNFSLFSKIKLSINYLKNIFIILCEK